jgi:hypothetical protein
MSPSAVIRTGVLMLLKFCPERGEQLSEHRRLAVVAARPFAGAGDDEAEIVGEAFEQRLPIAVGGLVEDVLDDFSVAGCSHVDVS